MTTTQLKAVVFDWIGEEDKIGHIYDIQVDGCKTKGEARRLASLAFEVAFENLPPDMEGEPPGKYLWSGEWWGSYDAYYHEYEDGWDRKELKLLKPYSEADLDAMYGPPA